MRITNIFGGLARSNRPISTLKRSLKRLADRYPVTFGDPQLNPRTNKIILTAKVSTTDTIGYGISKSTGTADSLRRHLRDQRYVETEVRGDKVYGSRGKTVDRTFTFDNTRASVGTIESKVRHAIGPRLLAKIDEAPKRNRFRDFLSHITP